MRQPKITTVHTKIIKQIPKTNIQKFKRKEISLSGFLPNITNSNHVSSKRAHSHTLILLSYGAKKNEIQYYRRKLGFFDKGA